MLLLRFPPRFHPTITRQNMLQKGEEGKFSISIIFFFIPPPPSLFSFNTIFEISLQACPDSLWWLMLISSQHLRVLKKTAPCVDNIPISKLINTCTHNFFYLIFFSLKFSFLPPNPIQPKTSGNAFQRCFIKACCRIFLIN